MERLEIISYSVVKQDGEGRREKHQEHTIKWYQEELNSKKMLE